MSKFGVGVGEDFPVNEGEQAEASEPCRGETACGDRHAAWRHWRRHMRARWRDHLLAKAEQLRREEPEGAVVLPRAHLHHLVIGALAVIGLAALVGHLTDSRS